MEYLKLTPRQTRYGVGLYELGDGHTIGVITDTGRVLWVSGRMIDSDDLMKAFVQGAMFERRQCDNNVPRYYDDEGDDFASVEAEQDD